MKFGRGFECIVLGAGLCTSLAFGQMVAVNGASFDAAQPMAPGSFASIFGQNLCSQTAAGGWIAPGQLPTNLGNCSVTVNGTMAMLQYVSDGQINFIVPPNIGPGTAGIAVNNGSQVVNGSMTIGPAGPGIFTMTGMGVGEGAMLNGMTYQLGPFSTITNDKPTVTAMYVTGLDLSSKPTVSVGGMPGDVMWWGNAPGYAGLQQINVGFPSGVAGAGRVPVTVTSGGVTSNVTFMEILPTTSMMQGMPGWGPGMMVGDNTPRGHELSYMAFSPSNNTALVTDENDDVVRVISLNSNTTTATITLPSGSQAHAIAVSADGTLAAVALSAKASIALIDLSQQTVAAVIGTGYYPSHLAFSGSNLLVTNEAGGSVSVIDTGARTVVQTVPVGLGPSGIAATPSLAVVANMQAGTISLVSMADYSVSNIALPAGTRPYEVAVSAAGNKALISTPMSDGFLILDLGTRAVTTVDTSVWNAMGPGAIVTNGSLAFIANMMTASVTAVDLAAGQVIKTFPVDPGPRALAVNAAKNQLLVLAEGTGTLDVVDLSSYAIAARLNAGDTERVGNWTLPLISSVTPNAAAPDSSFTLTIAGANLQAVKDIEFHIAGYGSGMGGGMGGGMMGGGGSGLGIGSEDPNIKVSNVQANAAGTQVTAWVHILSSAAAGTRQIRLETGQAEVMGMMSGTLFTVTGQ
jgi:uncharacterized protein (TIGR03437 family)